MVNLPLWRNVIKGCCLALSPGETQGKSIRDFVRAIRDLEPHSLAEDSLARRLRNLKLAEGKTMLKVT